MIDMFSTGAIDATQTHHDVTAADVDNFTRCFMRNVDDAEEKMRATCEKDSRQCARQRVVRACGNARKSSVRAYSGVPCATRARTPK